MIKRDTNKDLMENVFRMTKESGSYDKAEQIMDYYLPEQYKIRELKNYEFDFIARVQFGSSEGIYISCYLEGDFGQDKEEEGNRLKCGTFKTLGVGLEDMRIMGDLAGALTYFARVYIDQELERYIPEKELAVETD